MKQRRLQREAATAAKLQQPRSCNSRKVGPLAVMEGEEAAPLMQTKTTRLTDLIMQSPQEAAPSFHEDWTIVEGGASDPGKCEMEQRLWDARNRMIRDYLTDGRSLGYKSSGNSMWPLVQSGDACTFHPIQAVTAMEGNVKLTASSMVALNSLLATTSLHPSWRPRKLRADWLSVSSFLLLAATARGRRRILSLLT